MNRILCVAVMLSALSGPALAGMSEGVAAVTVGDYEKAISEFQPLAAAGDPAAQYQLARIYLEGRGPADGVPRGIELMTKAAHGGYPEAQAQLGLMYAMGLGVEIDNAQAYDWLTKAVTALPAGTRRTVAEANRDAVLKRMNVTEQNAVATAKPAKPAETKVATTTAKPTAVQEAAKKPAAETGKTTTAKATTTPVATAKTVTEAAATNKTTTTAVKAAGTTTAKATTDAAATDKTTANTAKATSTTAAKATTDAAATDKTTANTAKATSTTAAKTMTNAAATATKPAASETKASAKSDEGKSTQVASAKAPDAAPGSASQKTAASGVRIQLVSMPSEEAAWSAWKQLSGKYASHLSGLTAIVEPADLGTKGTFYRVQTGPFQTVAAAQERCTAMKAAGLDCLVVGKP